LPLERKLIIVNVIRELHKNSLTRTYTLDWSQFSIIFETFGKHPFMVGTRPRLIVVSGLSVGIPLAVGFRPQLVVFSGLLGGNPFDSGI
jgi:hypothetical protein